LAGKNAYLDALKLLARRELSEAQVRQRLTRRGHDDDTADAAVVQLKQEHAIDDARVAEAIARTEIGLKRRGRIRVRRKIEQAGIAPATARVAIDASFGAIDEETLINAALARRLREGAWIESDGEFQRLGRYLAGQGFDSDQIVRTLSARRRRR
jgi:regulatory protein